MLHLLICVRECLFKNKAVGGRMRTVENEGEKRTSLDDAMIGGSGGPINEQFSDDNKGGEKV